MPLQRKRRSAFGGKCFAERPLPDYPIARISTGQLIPDDSPIWQVEFPTAPPPPPSWWTGYESVAAGEPAARSVFDIYLRDNTLTYLKSPCGAADVQALFFLHIHWPSSHCRSLIDESQGIHRTSGDYPAFTLASHVRSSRAVRDRLRS